jgi:hypothetical protein
MVETLDPDAAASAVDRLCAAVEGSLGHSAGA